MMLCTFQLCSQQLCEGNLGDNIFSDGDFGSGSDVIFPVDPALAPGFQYTLNMPPDDGEYTLTNDMSKWTSIFSTWLQLRDNSLDPQGYMMVVNANFSAGVFYEQLVINVCENTLYEFSADIINLIRSGTTGHILPDVSFLINDVVRFSTGSIPQDEEWHTFGFTFTTDPGQSMLKLTLRNNAPGGVGNDLALDNISFRPCGPVSSISIDPPGKICENSLFPILTAHINADTGAIQWQISADAGMTFQNIPGAVDRTHQVEQLTAGIYFFRYLYANTEFNLSNPNCRVSSNFIEVEVVPVAFMIRDSLCEGMTFNLGGIEYGETGIYKQHLTASNGCDSIVTLYLDVFPDPPIEADFTFTSPSCEGANDGSLSIVSVSGTRPPFIFSINDSLVPPPSTSVKLPAGTYRVKIENEYGCFDEDEIIIPDGPALDIQTIDDITITLGHSVTFETTSNLPVAMALWTPALGVECPSCLSTAATPLESGTFVITAKTAEGCMDQDSIRVRVDRDPVVYIPNVFSPNHDQVNDFFQIFTDPLNVRSIELAIIFDRWGGILSEKAKLFNEGTVILWDGMTPAGPANPGTYVYLVSLILADNSTVTITGDVTLVR